MKMPVFQRKFAFAVLGTAIVLAAAGLRLLPLSAELWFDELWSVDFARTGRLSPGDLDGTAPPSRQQPQAEYTRSLFCAQRGRLCVLSAALLSGRDGGRYPRGPLRRAPHWLEAVIAASLFAVDSWFVLASAEARGYALAIALALAAYLALRHYLDKGGWPASFFFGSVPSSVSWPI